MDQVPVSHRCLSMPTSVHYADLCCVNAMSPLLLGVAQAGGDGCSPQACGGEGGCPGSPAQEAQQPPPGGFFHCRHVETRKGVQKVMHQNNIAKIIVSKIVTMILSHLPVMLCDPVYHMPGSHSPQSTHGLLA